MFISIDCSWDFSSFQLLLHYGIPVVPIEGSVYLLAARVAIANDVFFFFFFFFLSSIAGDEE